MGLRDFTLSDVIERNALLHGNRPAFVADGVRISHRDYALRVIGAIPPGPTEAEPNDASAGATVLQPGVPLAGVVGDAVDKDLFSVRVSQRGALRVQVVPPLGLDVALALVDEEDRVLWQVDDGGPRETEVMAAVGVQPPRAVFQVWAPHRQHTNAVSSYHIRADLLTGGAGEKEPNDSAATL